MRLLLLFLSFICAFAANAEDYTTETFHFRVTIPDGWKKVPNPSDEIALALASPRAEETTGLSLMLSEAVPGTDALTQEELDENLAGEMTNELWTESLKESGMKGVVVESAGVEKQNERNTYYAIVTYDDDDAVRHKMKAVVHFVPGWSYSVLCTARLDGYDKEAADFDTIFRSFTPLSRAIIAGKEADKPSVTLSKLKPDASALKADAARSGKALRALMNQMRQSRRN